jgi:glutathionylspermidine synthase
MLDDLLGRQGLVFGGRPLCTVLRPRLTTHARHAWLQGRVRILMRVFAKTYAAAIASADFRRQFMLTDWEETLVQDDPGIRNPSPTSRLDTFIIDDDDEMKLTEYNAETPAGAAYGDALNDAFIDLPVVRAFARKYEVMPIPARSSVLHVLLATYEEWLGRRELPRIAIVDWPDVPTVTEFEMYRDYFHSRGIECEIANPRDAEYRNGRLSFGDGEPVDLIYKRVLIHELVEQCGLDSPMVQAVRDRAVCMANGFRCKILHKKASLAALSDERNAHLFDATERAAIDAHIPWTRTVIERQTSFEGRQVELVPFMEEHRERLVLKPNDDYGGAGITLGWTVDDATWREAIAKALSAPHIVQERVRIPYEPYPSMVDGTIQIVDRMLDTAPFVSYGEYMEGYLTRLSTAALLNVTAGGGSSVPSFLVEKR